MVVSLVPFECGWSVTVPLVRPHGTQHLPKPLERGLTLL
jgi:hypothetical protein